MDSPGFKKLGGFEEALKYAQDGVDEFFKVIPLDRLRKTTVATFFIDCHPEIKPSRSGGPETQIYEVSDRLALSIAVHATAEVEFYEIASLICAANVLNGAPVPQPLRAFASSVLFGDDRRPKSTGPKRGKDLILKMFLRGCVMELTKLFDVNVSRAEGGAEQSACDIMKLVCEKHGYHVGYNTLRDWCQHAKQQPFREQADRLSGLFKDSYLNFYWCFEGTSIRSITFEYTLCN